MILREPITDFPLDIPVDGFIHKHQQLFKNMNFRFSVSLRRAAGKFAMCDPGWHHHLAASWTVSSDAARIPAAQTTAREPRSRWWPSRRRPSSEDRGPSDTQSRWHPPQTMPWPRPRWSRWCCEEAAVAPQLDLKSQKIFFLIFTLYGNTSSGYYFTNIRWRHELIQLWCHTQVY